MTDLTPAERRLLTRLVDGDTVHRVTRKVEKRLAARGVQLQKECIRHGNAWTVWIDILDDGKSAAAARRLLGML